MCAWLSVSGMARGHSASRVRWEGGGGSVVEVPSAAHAQRCGDGDTADGVGEWVRITRK